MPEHFSSGRSRYQSYISSNFTIASACALQALPCRPLRQLSAPRLIQSNNYVPGGISCAADFTAIFRHKISVSGAPSGKRLLSASAHSPGGGRCFQRPAHRRCCRPGKADPPQSAAGGAHRKKILRPAGRPRGSCFHRHHRADESGRYL